MRKFLALLAIVAALAVLVIGALSAIRRVEDFRTLEADFSPQAQGLLVTAVRDSELRPGDRLVLVNEFEVTSVHEVVDRLSGRESSEALVLRQGRLVRVAMQPPGINISWPYLAQIAIGIAYLAVGGFALARRRSKPGLLFFTWCILSATIFLVSPGRQLATLQDQISYAVDEIARVFLPAVTLHLFAVLPRPLALIEKSRVRALLFYIPAIVLFLLQADLVIGNGRWFGQVGGDSTMAMSLARLDLWELVHIVIAGLGAAAILGFRALTETDWEPRRQLMWIAVGVAAGYLPFAFLYVAPQIGGRHIPEWREFVAVAALVFVPLSFGYAYLRYRLADIGILLRSGVSTALTLFVGVVGFSVVNLILKDVMADAAELPRNLVSFSAGLAIAGLMVPTRRSIRDSLERLQYGSRVSFRRDLAEFANRVTEEDSHGLAHELLSQISLNLDLPRLELFLVEGQKLQPVQDWTAMRLAVEDFSETWDKEHEVLQPMVLVGETMSAQTKLHKDGYRYVFPLVSRGEPVALFTCSHHHEDVPLNSDDLGLLRDVLDQAALALDNARLFHTVEEQLEEVSRMQEFTHSILESSPAGIAVLDSEGQIRSANRALARILTRTASDLEGQPLTAVLNIDKVERGQLNEAQVERADGSVAHLQLSTADLSDPSAAEPLTVLLVQDVTEQVEMERALQERERLASLGMLAAGVAHEVNTPITGISSYAQLLLQDTSEDDPRYEILKKVEQQTFRASRIVNNLLSLSRGSTGPMATVDLSSTLHDCVDLLGERRRAAGVDLDMSDLPEDLQVVGNEGELSQVFTNLLVNAIDAMSAHGGLLTVQAASEGGRARVVISDTGPGIPREIQPRIFQPFFSTKKDRGGTGLGLSISFNIVERHNGEIRFATRPGGTQFTVELPLAPDDQTLEDGAPNDDKHSDETLAQPGT